MANYLRLKKNAVKKVTSKSKKSSTTTKKTTSKKKTTKARTQKAVKTYKKNSNLNGANHKYFDTGNYYKNQANTNQYIVNQEKKKGITGDMKSKGKDGKIYDNKLKQLTDRYNTDIDSYAIKQYNEKKKEEKEYKARKKDLETVDWKKGVTSIGKGLVDVLGAINPLDNKEWHENINDGMSQIGYGLKKSIGNTIEQSHPIVKGASEILDKIENIGSNAMASNTKNMIDWKKDNNDDGKFTLGDIFFRQQIEDDIIKENWEKKQRGEKPEYDKLLDLDSNAHKYDKFNNYFFSDVDSTSLTTDYVNDYIKKNNITDEKEISELNARAILTGGGSDLSADVMLGKAGFDLDLTDIARGTGKATTIGAKGDDLARLSKLGRSLDATQLDEIVDSSIGRVTKKDDKFRFNVSDNELNRFRDKTMNVINKKNKVRDETILTKLGDKTVAPVINRGIYELQKKLNTKGFRNMQIDDLDTANTVLGKMISKGRIGKEATDHIDNLVKKMEKQDWNKEELTAFEAILRGDITMEDLELAKGAQQYNINLEKIRSKLVEEADEKVQSVVQKVKTRLPFGGKRHIESIDDVKTDIPQRISIDDIENRRPEVPKNEYDMNKFFDDVVPEFQTKKFNNQKLNDKSVNSFLGFANKPPKGYNRANTDTIIEELRETAIEPEEFVDYLDYIMLNEKNQYNLMELARDGRLLETINTELQRYINGIENNDFAVTRHGEVKIGSYVERLQNYKKAIEDLRANFDSKWFDDIELKRDGRLINHATGETYKDFDAYKKGQPDTRSPIDMLAERLGIQVEEGTSKVDVPETDKSKYTVNDLPPGVDIDDEGWVVTASGDEYESIEEYFKAVGAPEKVSNDVKEQIVDNVPETSEKVAQDVSTISVSDKTKEYFKEFGADMPDYDSHPNFYKIIDRYEKNIEAMKEALKQYGMPNKPIVYEGKKIFKPERYFQTAIQDAQNELHDFIFSYTRKGQAEHDYSLKFNHKYYGETNNFDKSKNINKPNKLNPELDKQIPDMPNDLGGKKAEIRQELVDKAMEVMEKFDKASNDKPEDINGTTINFPKNYWKKAYDKAVEQIQEFDKTVASGDNNKLRKFGYKGEDEPIVVRKDGKVIIKDTGEVFKNMDEYNKDLELQKRLDEKIQSGEIPNMTKEAYKQWEGTDDIEKKRIIEAGALEDRVKAVLLDNDVNTENLIELDKAIDDLDQITDDLNKKLNVETREIRKPAMDLMNKYKAEIEDLLLQENKTGVISRQSRTMMQESLIKALIRQEDVLENTKKLKKYFITDEFGFGQKSHAYKGHITQEQVDDCLQSVFSNPKEVGEKLGDLLIERYAVGEKAIYDRKATEHMMNLLGYKNKFKAPKGYKGYLNIGVVKDNVHAIAKDNVIEKYGDKIKSMDRDELNNVFNEAYIKTAREVYGVDYYKDLNEMATPFLDISSKRYNNLRDTMSSDVRYLDPSTVSKFNIARQLQITKQKYPLLRLYDNFTTAYKSVVTAYNPTWQTKNFFDNFLQSYLEVGVQALSPKRHDQSTRIVNEIMGDRSLKFYGKELKLPSRNLDNIKLDKKYAGPEYEHKMKLQTKYGNTDYTYQDIIDALDDAGLVESTAFAENLGKKSYQSVKEIVGSDMSLADKTKAIINDYMLPQSEKSVWSAGGNHNIIRAECIAKTNIVLARLDEGFSLEDAIDSANHALFDYNDLSRFESEVLKRVMPFYTWSRKNVPYQLEAMFKAPLRVNAMLDARDMLNDAGQELSGYNEEDEDRNKYTDGMVRLPFNKSELSTEGINKGGYKWSLDNQYGMFVDLELPMDEFDKFPMFTEWDNKDNPRQFYEEEGESYLNKLNPLIKLAYDLGTNEDFLDKQIYDEDASKEDKIKAMLEYANRETLPLQRIDNGMILPQSWAQMYRRYNSEEDEQLRLLNLLTGNKVKWRQIGSTFHDEGMLPELQEMSYDEYEAFREKSGIKNMSKEDLKKWFEIYKRKGLHYER